MMALLATAVPATATASLVYYGGDIQNTPRIHLTFWGKNWNQHSGARTQIRDMFTSISGSEWQGILTQYYDYQGFVSPSVSVDYWTDESINAPSNVNDTALINEIQYAIAQRGWPGGGVDNMYVVLPAPGSGYAFGFVEGCGAHRFSGQLNAPYFHVGWSGDPPYNTGCQSTDPAGLERPWAALMVTASHEYAETVTDPITPKYAGTVTGWATPGSATGFLVEIGNLCDGTSTQLPNGAYVQQLWSNKAGKCVSGEPLPPPSQPAPTVETKPVSDLTETQAKLNGTVNGNGASTTYHFEWGKTTDYGNQIPIPDGNTGSGSAVAYDTIGVLPRTRYHYRIVATNASGTSYGADQAFTTGLKWTARNSNSGGNPELAFWFGLPGEKRVVGDWDGNGTQTPGVYNPTTGVWKLRNSNTTGAANITFQYGGSQYRPVVGDWDGDGDETIGLYEPKAGNWGLRNSNSGGNPDIGLQYGGSQFDPVTGDWDNNGTDTIGVYEPAVGMWYLRNSNSGGSANISFQYGGSQYEPLAGDWDGVGADTIGVYEPKAGTWGLRNSNSGGNPDISFQYGGSQFVRVNGDWDGNGTVTPALTYAQAPTAIEWGLRNSNSAGSPDIGFEAGSPGEEPLAGDWDGDGDVTIGRYDPVPGIWRLINSHSATATPIEFQYGGSQFKPVVGDWDGDGDDTIGLYEPIEGRWQLRNSNSGGNPNLDFNKYGGSQFRPVTGDWDGDGDDTIGLYEPKAGTWGLRNSNSGGNPDIAFQYGGSQYDPVTGDWDKNGTVTAGLYEPAVGKWNLRNSNSGGNPDITFQHGGSQFRPATGDWDGDGDDTVGLVTW